MTFPKLLLWTVCATVGLFLVTGLIGRAFHEIMMDMDSCVAEIGSVSACEELLYP
jgi:hypothetical protein